MNARRIQGAIGIAALALLLVPATALSSKVFYSATDGKALITFAIKSGKKEKITDFSFDGLKCGGEHLAGGLEDPVKIKRKDRTFESEQQVTETDDLEAKLKGKVSKDATEVNGRLKLVGVDCATKVTFDAAPAAE